MKRRWLPVGVTAYKDRHGRTRYRYRKAGLPTYSFKNQPGTPEFLAELARAQNALPPPPKPRFEAGTVDAVTEALYNTPRWRSMKPSSQKTYRSILERFRANNGDLKVAAITSGAIDRKLAQMEATPAAANNLRKALSRLFKQAIKMGLMRHNPVSFTDAFRIESEGFHTWTEDELAQFEAHWPNGTRERLAYALLLYTALRRSDMVNVGPDNRKGNRLHLSHGKNNSDTSIPILPPLEDALAPFEATTGTYLQTQFGKPYTANGFGNWFRRVVRAAGLPDRCSAHGLRKAMSRRLAESGATVLQGRAVTGHKTDREFARYAERANKAGMADIAMANLADKLAKDGAE